MTKGMGPEPLSRDWGIEEEIPQRNCKEGRRGN